MGRGVCTSGNHLTVFVHNDDTDLTMWVVALILCFFT